MFMGVARWTGLQARIKTEFGFGVKRGVERTPPRGRPRRHRASRPRAKSRQAPSAAGGT